MSPIRSGAIYVEMQGLELKEETHSAYGINEIGDLFKEEHTYPATVTARLRPKGKAAAQFKRLKRRKLRDLDSACEDRCFPNWNRTALLVQEETEQSEFTCVTASFYGATSLMLSRRRLGRQQLLDPLLSREFDWDRS